MQILGGMMVPMVPAVATREAEYARSYPASSISGIIIRPIAATVAEPVPEIAAKIMQATMETMPRPPVRLPSESFATLIRRLEIPPLPMMSPAKVNSGIATRVKELKPDMMALVKLSRESGASPKIRNIEANDWETAIGNEQASSKINVTNSVAIMLPYLLRGCTSFPLRPAQHSCAVPRRRGSTWA